MTLLRTEFPFVLPRGFVDSSGTVHRRGQMRLATAMDEITPLRDPRVRQNHAYLTVILLSRVITRLGTLAMIDTSVVEGMFTSDVAFLQELYRRKNASVEGEEGEGGLECPACGEHFQPPEEAAIDEAGAVLEPSLGE